MLTFDSFKPSTGTSKGYERSIQTVCRECTAGCGLWAFTQGGHIVDVQGDASHPVNRGRLCARGSAFVKLLNHPSRITKVLNHTRADEDFEVLESWESGLDLLANRMKQARERNGPESLVVSCHMHGGSDFLLGARRFARLWGTPHVYPMENGAGNGTPAAMATGRLPDLDWSGSGCLFLVEADLASTHPVLFGWILEAQRRGTKICAVDSQYTATLAKADMSRMIRPDSGNWLGTALMKILLEEKHCPSASITARLVDAEAWQTSFAQMPSEAALHASGISLDLLRPMARFLASHGPIMVITGRRLGTLPHRHIWPTMVHAMGWSDRLQGGWYPLTSGLADLKVTGDIGDGNAMDTVPDPPQMGSGFWDNTRKPAREAAPRLWISSSNGRHASCFPFEHTIHEMDLVAYFGSCLNPAARQAHLVFPAATWPEKDDLCFGENGIRQWGRRIVDAVDGPRTGLDFWTGLARRFGWEDRFPWIAHDGRADLRAFYNWALQQSPWLQGVQVDALTAEPCFMGIGDGSQTPPVQRITPMPAPDAEACKGLLVDGNRFPLLLTAPLGRDTEGPDPVMPLGCRPADGNSVLIHPQIGQVLAIESGDMVVIQNDRENWKAKACLTRSIPLWMVRSAHSGRPTQVLVHKVGADPQGALAALKGMGL